MSTTNQKKGISIVIAVYNGEDFLKRCLDSVLGQDYQNMEIVIVNDGSTDQSGYICDKYADRYGRKCKTTVLHRKHTGLMEARYTGLKTAIYENIAFVDADDWIEKNHISLMMEQAALYDADLVVGGVTVDHNGKSEARDNFFQCGVYDRERISSEIFPEMLYRGGDKWFGLTQYMWNKVFRKDKLKKCYEKIDRTVNDGEDVLTFYTYMLETANMAIVNGRTYHYCIRSDSMTQKIKPGYLDNVSRLYRSLRAQFIGMREANVLMPQLDSYLRMMVMRSDMNQYISAQKYIFPYLQVGKLSDVVLYGAGIVGKNYVHQIMKSGYCRLIAWVDQKYKKMDEFEGITPENPEKILNLKYNHIVIAIEDERVSNSVKKMLVDAYGVDMEKIVMRDSR